MIASGTRTVEGAESAAVPRAHEPSGPVRDHRIAVGAIEALREAGRDVPGDVSVVGFDDHLLASQYSPGITTVHQPLREEGARAAELALAMIDGAPPETVVMDMRLVERASV